MHQTMNYGRAGMLSRSSNHVIEPRAVGDTPPERYGHAVSLAEDGSVVKVSAGCPIMLYGFMIGAYPRGNENPVARKTDNVAKVAYFLTDVQKGEPYSGCPVFVRIDGEDKENCLFIGGLEAEADGLNTLEYKFAIFTGEKDANGVAEVNCGQVVGQ